MAGLKKKKKEKNPNPNVVLIVFLVFFVLVTIGLGIWGYYGYAEQGQLRTEREKAKLDAKVAKFGKQYYSLLYRELRTALGDKLDEKEIEQVAVDRAEFEKDGAGNFKEETDRETAKKLLGDLKEALGGLDEAKNFRLNYKQQLQAADVKAKELEGKLNAAIEKQVRMETLSKDLKDSQANFHKTANERVDKGNALALAEAQKRSDEFNDLAKKVELLNAELAGKAEAYQAELHDLKKDIKVKEKLITVLQAEKKELLALGGGGGTPLNAGKPGAEPFPLVLDLSTGAPLWDAPVGKIVRVDLELRQVFINIGSAHGAKPELTFNIFGAGSAGKALGQLKGSIEIVKVLGADSSMARITSLYDTEGREILLNLDARGRLLRETEAPIRAGDLLFNLFWGARVAVAGYVSITGEPSDNPAEQVRQMEDFMFLLKRNGMTVDAYVDLRNGQIKGSITPKTRYLIKGYDVGAVAEAKPKMPDEGKDKDKDMDKDKEKDKVKEKEKDKEMAAKDKEAGAKEPQANSERNDNINKSNLALRSEARSNGLLIISAENFAVVIGYRKARNLNSPEIVTFRPSLPYAGSGEGGVRILPDAPPPKEKGDMDK